jgi:hypothetical protein
MFGLSGIGLLPVSVIADALSAVKRCCRLSSAKKTPV